ncbi:division/cell wall cluster transcriptional repressor MraZ [Alloalcanivorax mobilis]|uniref:division/cell wall cluster transcriptional repressor MraZ n=1 Tax=Alloalcanivorax mobilis TaxID=2019569 RepID=UPI000B5B1BCD|nr:division/cell wall cluster transcriptional repressor MraZ [Alloalcanivorax mobilis]ASK34869.1 division/cell wall cluster transcriptional repressor MraZ [Alcanivorax sp. N3-2A]
MFNGRTALNLDAKGRLTVPTRYRESLNGACGGRVVLTQHPYDACLVMYPLPEWKDIARQVAAQSDAHAQVRALKRRFLGQAVEVDMDGSGRLLVAPELRSVVGLDKKAMLVGLMHRFEIWAEETWIELEQQNLDQDAMPESVQALSF